MDGQLEELKNNIDVISTSVENVKKKQLAVLADPYNDTSKKDELNKLEANIRLIGNQVRQNLKILDEKLKNEQRSNANSTYLRIYKTQHAALSRKYIEIMSEYNQAQIYYKERCKNRLQRRLDIAGTHLNEDQLDEMIESGDPAVFTQGILKDTKIAKETLADIEARHEDLTKLESDIVLINDMFNDIAMLIENQGEIVDRIDVIVGDTVNSVEAGVTDVKKAMVNQKKARKKKLLIALGICICVTLVLIILTCCTLM